MLRLKLTNLLTLLFLSFLFSCSEQEEHPSEINPIRLFEARGKTFFIDRHSPPKKFSLDQMPKPRTIEVPIKPEGSYTISQEGEKTKVELLPPEVKPAGLFYLMKNYTANDGLALDILYSGIITPNGVLWFGSDGGGVSRFDGYSFTVYFSHALTGGVVWAILQDRKGNIWFGTEDGASKYDGVSFNPITTDQGLANNFVRSIFEDSEGNLWFATEGGASRYDGKEFTNYTQANGLIHNIVWSIIQDQNKNVWFGTQGGVSKYDGKKFTNFTKEQGLVDNLVRVIYADKKGNLWFGTQNGVSKFDGTSFTSFTKKNGLADDSIWTIFEDSSGDIWFGTEGGASRYDGDAFTNYSINEGLSGRDVRSIVEDKTGNLWFGLAGGGVNRFDGDAFRNYGTAQGLVNHLVRGITKDKLGNFWFGTEGGVSKYDGKTFTNYTDDQGLANNSVRGVYQDDQGYLWFGTAHGVSRFDGVSFTTFTTQQGLPNNAVRFILQDRSGFLWFATFGGGVAKYDGKTFTNYSTEQGLVNNYVRDIIEDRFGNLWFSTDNGISKFDGKSFTNFTQGLGDNYVMSIFEDKVGNLWLSTIGGLTRYDGKTFITYTTSQGLPDDHIYRTIATQEQYLFSGTNQGFAILTGFIPNASSASSQESQEKIPPQNNLSNAELIDRYKPIFENYNGKNGYPVADLNSGEGSIFLDNNGIIWFGTGAEKTGLVRFDYSALHKNNEPPNVMITAMKIDNEYVCWYDLLKSKTLSKSAFPPRLTEEMITFGRVLSHQERVAMRNKFSDIKFSGITPFYYVPQNLELPYSHNNITFKFNAIETNRPRSVLYQYLLEGYSKTWSPPSNETSATFGNIFEGKYRLKIKARSPYGIWSDPITYSFRVHPPWYRTWQAYILYVISSISIIYLIFLWRTRVLRQRFERLQVLYQATERFVPKAFLNILKKKNIEEVELGESVEIEVTALFSDIRGCTTIMEKQTPQEAFGFINTYLKEMAPIIRAHEGFINTFMGDGIMALFPHSADDAVTAVQAMEKALVQFNSEQAKQNMPIIKVGYGLNTGKAMVGTVGEKERMEANVIGDTINLASRVESLNKFYGTDFLVSEGTIKGLKDKSLYSMRLVDKVMVIGKKNPIYLYEISLQDSVSENKRIFIELYEKAFREYEKGNFSQAVFQFRESLKYDPNNRASIVFIARCEQLLKRPLPKMWNGVYEMTEK